jgi:hypothetical protein
MLILQPDWIATERERRYRRLPALRVQTIEAATEFIEDVGFAMFWPIKDVEAPSRFHALAGRERRVPNEHDDPDISLCWGWKDQSLGGPRWYYSHLLRRKATLIAPRLWAAFYALTRNYGDLRDYLEQVRERNHDTRGAPDLRGAAGARPVAHGRAAAQDRHDGQREQGALRARPAGPPGDMKALPVGVAEAGAWRYSFVYDIPMRHNPGLAEQARQIGTRQAWETAARPAHRQYRGRQHPADRPVLPRVRADGPRAGTRTGELVEAGRIEVARIEGGGEVWVSRWVLDGAC